MVYYVDEKDSPPLAGKLFNMVSLWVVCVKRNREQRFFAACAMAQPFKYERLVEDEHDSRPAATEPGSAFPEGCNPQAVTMSHCEIRDDTPFPDASQEDIESQRCAADALEVDFAQNEDLEWQKPSGTQRTEQEVQEYLRECKKKLLQVRHCVIWTQL